MFQTIKNRPFYLMIALAVILIGFQNCSKHSFSNINDQSETETLGSQGQSPEIILHGNGDGYLGKATHVVYDVQGSCSQSRDVVKSAIEKVSNSEYYLLRENCQDIVRMRIDENDIQTQANSPDIFVYSSMAFQEVTIANPQNSVARYCWGGHVLNADDTGADQALVTAEMSLHHDSMTGNYSVDYYIEIRDPNNNALRETRQRQNAPATFMDRFTTGNVNMFSVYALNDPNYMEFWYHADDDLAYQNNQNHIYDFHTVHPTLPDYESVIFDCVLN